MIRLLLLVSVLAVGAVGVRAQPLLDWSPEEIRAVGRHGPWPPPPVHDSSNKVSGVPAVRTTARFQVTGRPAHGEILSLLRGRTLWQVQVLGPQAQAAEVARRVMESVRLQP